MTKLELIEKFRRMDEEDFAKQMRDLMNVCQDLEITGCTVEVTVTKKQKHKTRIIRFVLPSN